MYQDHFGLHADPFTLSPNLKFLFRSQAHAETMAHLGYGLEQGEDIIMISGAIGTGKTLALQNLLSKVSRLFSQVLVNVTAVSYLEFLKLVLDEMGETWPDQVDAADLLIRLKRKARAVNEDGRKILLVVDEAQNLDPETLEGVRLLTNMGQPDRQFFQIILAGQPGLEQLVEHPDLAQLRQRIRVHYRLEPLTQRETEQYLQHRTSVAGALRPLFTVAAARRIHELSGGIPRLVNHLASHAMLAAYVDRDQQVDARHVDAEGLPETPIPPPAVTPARPAPQRPPSDHRPEPQPSRRRTTTVADPTGRRRGGRMAAWAWLAVLAVLLVAGWYLGRDGRLAHWTRPSAPELPAQVVRQDPRPATPPDPVVAEPEAVREAEPEPEPEPEPADEPDPVPVVPITEVDTRPLAPAVEHWVHVASYRDARHATRYRDRLDRSGLDTEVQAVTLDDGRVWHRVLVGPFPDSASAADEGRRLQGAGLVSFQRTIAR